jgi:hypothetical protein
MDLNLEPSVLTSYRNMCEHVFPAYLRIQRFQNGSAFPYLSLSCLRVIYMIYDLAIAESIVVLTNPFFSSSRKKTKKKPKKTYPEGFSKILKKNFF